MTSLTQEKKINIIYSYLFSDNKSLEEEDFWNKLSENDLIKINKIEKEETSDFNSLKSEIL